MSNNAFIWHNAPPKPVLHKDEVHIWRSSLDKNERQLNALQVLLSDDEAAKSDRLLAPMKKQRFMVARGQLRMILGAYLDTEPSSLQFSYGSHGKPALSGACSNKGLCFNLSHSANLVLYAVTLNREIGIDLEKIRDLDYKKLAGRYFSPEESRKLSELPESQQKQAFFRCWTRKEAFLKAKGAGFSFPLNKFEVSLSPGLPPALLNNALEPDETKNWQIEDILTDKDYAAALAAKSPNLSICYYNFD